MDTTGEACKAGERPGRPVEPVRRGKSGEGARSALEQLIHQEQRRIAQLPRDDAGPVAPAKPCPS